MALFFNGQKIKVNANGSVKNLIVNTVIQILNNMKLKSSDYYDLKSFDNFILTVKEEN